MRQRGQKRKKKRGRESTTRLGSFFFVVFACVTGVDIGESG
jgi:hypothetical protein